jgi:hypothetical protein
MAGPNKTYTQHLLTNKPNNFLVETVLVASTVLPLTMITAHTLALELSRNIASGGIEAGLFTPVMYFELRNIGS